LSASSELPFDSLESAHEYIQLLLETLEQAKQDLAGDVAYSESHPDRRLEALRLVQYKLEKLEHHLESSSRLLNDLRTLRRLLFDERALSVPKRTNSTG
jgi:uncharacterized membrane protein YccC